MVRIVPYAPPGALVSVKRAPRPASTASAVPSPAPACATAGTLPATPPARMPLQQRPQLQRVDDSLPAIVIIRKHVHVVRLLAHRVQPLDPLPQLPLAVQVVVPLVRRLSLREPVLRVSSMQPHVRAAPEHVLRRRQTVAQPRLVDVAVPAHPAQRLQRLRLRPRRVPHLHKPLEIRKALRQSPQPVHRHRRKSKRPRKLHQQRPQQPRLPHRPHALAKLPHDLAPRHLRPLVRENLRQLEGETELPRHQWRPSRCHPRRRNAIKAGVDLDRVEIPCQQRQWLEPPRLRARVHDALPVVVAPPGRSDPQSRGR